MKKKLVVRRTTEPFLSEKPRELVILGTLQRIAYSVEAIQRVVVGRTSRGT